MYVYKCLIYNWLIGWWMLGMTIYELYSRIEILKKWCLLIIKIKKILYFSILLITLHRLRIVHVLNNLWIAYGNSRKYTLGYKNTKSYYDLAPINQYDYKLKLTFMKTLSNSPPPFKIGEFDLIFYFYFSTDQNRYDMYSEFIINFNTPNLRRWIIAVKHTHIFSNLLIHTKTNVYPLYAYPSSTHIVDTQE